MSSSSSSTNVSLSQHLVYICSRFLAYGLPLLFFLVVVSFYLKTYDSAQIKITFTQMGTIILIMVWGIKILTEGRPPFSKADLIYVLPFLCFLGSGLVSFVHTPFKAWSSEETSRRVFYMAISLITIAEMRSAERMTRLFRWLMAAGWIAVGYGFIQYLDGRFFTPPAQGLDPFIWRQAFGHRVFSTFGNPNFYGNFLVIMTPLVLASVLRNKGPLLRPFILLVLTLGIALGIDRMMSGGFDPSYRVVFGAVILSLLVLFLFFCTWKAGKGSLPMFLVFFSLLFINLFATETKGAWLGFTAAIGVTVFFIFEYFLHLEDRVVNPKKYFIFICCLGGAFAVLLTLMTMAFIVPLMKRTIEQMGFQFLWIPTVIAGAIAVVVMFWVIRQPWNLKKVIYGMLVFFILSMGGGVLQFAKTRLVSVSFRIFTWISTWEMIRTSPLVGNGVGTFKIIYPAYRRPQIIVLEGKSNTETDHAEDEYLEIWQDEGIVGFGIFLWLVVTTIVFGLKQLRWYSLLRVPDKSKKRKLFDIQSDPRSYEVLGYLGAYVGALIHWFVDVSIRFVSSGVFSGLLPAAIVAYARNRSQPVMNEIKMSYDRWIRLGAAGIWTIILLWLRVELVPQSQIRGGETTTIQIWTWIILSGISLFVMLEILEFGLSSNQNLQPGTPPDISNRMIPVRWAGAGVLLIIGFICLKYCGLQFHADVHHNMAIFFSKEAIWTKSPVYDARIQSFPPDIRKKYQNTGGALEHYAAVNAKNHAFPMAYYFTGNVYNDWGSQIFAESMNTRAKGDLSEAERLKQKSTDMWLKSEAAYNNTKKLAPNYVQTHHQMGVLNSKRAEMAAQWGETEKATEFQQEALKNFKRYRMLDPVFPQNYDRIAQILVPQGKTVEAIELYKEAIYTNDVIARSIHNWPFADRLTQFGLALGKLYYSEAARKSPDPFHPKLPEIDEAVKYFRLSVEHDPKNVEAWKGLGFMLEKLGRGEEAQQAYQRAHALSPNDPDWRINAAPSN